jgi:hypothetical protein
MQLTPLSLLVAQCSAIAERLETIQSRTPAGVSPLFARSGLQSDLQRVYAVELILMRLERVTPSVQAEVAEAIGDLLETIDVTYGSIASRPET